ncbi:cation-independent mannose-6-phosphate receptor [Dermacentor andersoni]|uniref:cation-independent mannose-6-phosphate receptor n=1 Tax=Dermacentor andersoni TaxID=34620 RepID=UPI003B3ADB0B
MHLREFSAVGLILSVFGTLAAAGNDQNVCTDSIGVVNGPVMFRSTWQMHLPPEEGVHSDLMYLSVCEPLSFPAGSPAAVCNGKSACRVTDGKAEVYAEFSANASNVVVSEGWIFVKGNQCAGSSNTNYKISIRVSCAAHLGSPEYFIDMKCQLFLMWRTSAVCAKKPARTEVPCTAYTDGGSRHDLSGLIKSVGGYMVETTDPATSLVINICSDMASADGITYPPMTGACILDGKECKSIGQLESGLQANGSVIYIEYPSSPGLTPRPGCTKPPRTVVQFRCPHREKSHAPRLISDVNCHYYVEWETQHACSLDLLRADPADCKFTSDVHGIDIDLSPLQKQDGYRTTETTINGTKAVIKYNICGKSLGTSPVQCGKKRSFRSAVCAEIKGQSLSLGQNQDQILQLVDDVITMKFKDGSECDSAGSMWSSEIHFVCNKKGDDEMQYGWVDRDACTYHFIWETAHACPKTRGADCIIEHEDVRIDLRPLSRSGGVAPWTALGSLKSDNESVILINVCEGLGETDVAKECGATSAVCVKKSSGKSAIYGTQPSKLAYDKSSKTASMSSEGGRCWNGKNLRSVINFVCKPGAVSTSPRLVREVESECLLEFEWHTALACPRVSHIGQDCKVYNDALGFTIDLNPLKSSKPYALQHEGYRFFINVCGNVTDSPCTGDGKNMNTSVCQVSIADGRFWSLGQVNSNLTYIDGMLNLTYTNGTPYNDPARTPRSSSLTFLCDYEAGIGQPQFMDEANRTYAFVWRTSYACPPTYFVGCVYRDPRANVSYDLSRLNQANPDGDWIAEQHETDYTAMAYVSVCRPLRRAPLGCSSKAAVCIVHTYRNGTERVVIANAGQARHAPQNMSSLLTLQYDHGDPCPYKKNATYSSLIHFMCDVNQPEQLHYLKSGETCQHKFLWVTHMACPVSHLEAHDSCMLTDRQGTTYSLSSLHLQDSFYTVTHGDIIYELNVCGPVHGGHCSSQSNTSVCMVRGTSAKQLAKTNGMSLSSDDPGSLRLTYVGNYTNHSATAFKVVIDATCNEGTNGHHMSLLMEEPSLVVFGLSTPLACEPLPAKCIFDDVYGYEYDLTPLQLRTGNWEVYHSKSNRRFHISFCQSLNPSPGYSCPSGAAVCETDALQPNQPGISWGNAYGTPTVTSDGAVLVEYPNGGPCSNGLHTRKTIISLICNDEQVGPSFVAESEDCEILFDFQTPAACPLKMAKGLDCQVQDPRYGYVYDMSMLKNASADYEVHAPGFTYLINICQPLKSAKSGCTGAAICQTKPADAEFSVDAGKPNSTLVYRNGFVTLTYAQGSGGCKGSFNRTSVITFVCDHSTMGWQGPEFLSESEDCIYTFEWRTLLACPPIIKSECSISLGKAGLVDLSPLSNPRENYIVTTAKGIKYVINVCRSVVYGPGSACVKTAGACAVLKPHVTQNIGQVQLPPVFEDGIVKIKYTSGDICQTRSSRSSPVRMQTVIEFECDKNIKAGYPILLREERCTYYFQWRTAYACPMAEDAVYDNCTVVHPLTNEEFDLSVLRSLYPVNVTHDGITYSMSVCGSLPADLCGPGAGMCAMDNKTGKVVSLGKSNGHIHLMTDGVMFLKYSDGDKCPSDLFLSSARRSSVIQFMCASAGRSHLGPQLLHVDSSCTYYFVWYTERACRRVLHCVVEEGTEQYDLSPLIKSTGRHTVLNLVDPGYTYYINVCQPVHAVAPYHMLSNAGLIRTSKTTGSVESLGEVFMEPFNDFEGHVTLLYVNGSQCAYNSSASNRARVIFICDPSTTVEEPVLLDIDKENCLYIFEWRTNLVCPEVNKKAVPTENCTFSIPQHGLSFDLSALKPNASSMFEVPDHDGKGKFMLDICGKAKRASSDCDGSSVCFVSANEKSNYGTLSSFTYIQGGLKVMYTNGSRCNQSEAATYSAAVNFQCDENAGIGTPVLEHRHACYSTFVWKTNLVCVPDHRQCVLTSGNYTYDFGLLASVSHVKNVTDKEGNIYWLNVCSDMSADHQNVQSCPSTAAVCMRKKDRGGHDFTIGKAQSLKLSSPGFGQVHMMYGGGDPYVCHNRTSQHPSTLILHQCMTGASSTGVLEFVRGPTPEECLFVFRWESRTACPTVQDIVYPEKDGIIVEKRLNLAMNLSSILNSAFNVSENRGKDSYTYVVSLGGPVATGIPGACTVASVCQSKAAAGFYRDVGSFSTKKFVVRGADLLLEMESLGSKCGRTNKSVKSIIRFDCSKSAGLGSPEFLYESGKCHYLFRWATAHVCYNNFIRLIEPDSDRLVSPASVSSSATVGIVTAAVIIFVLASAGLYLMRHKLRTLVDLTCYKSLGAIRVPQYHYSKTTSQLRSTDENGDTELLTSGSSMNSADEPNDTHVLT